MSDKIFERVVLSSDQIIMAHSKKDCKPPCALHSPSSHPMITWKLVYREDIGLLERVCEHGIGHPDPDSVKFLIEQMGMDESITVHGCDDCCSKENKYKQEA